MILQLLFLAAIPIALFGVGMLMVPEFWLLFGPPILAGFFVWGAWKQGEPESAPARA